MATYYMDKEVQEISEITGRTMEDILAELNINNGKRGCEAWNRGEQIKVIDMLKEARADKKAKEIRKERLEGFRWAKIDGQWMVAGDFNAIAEGSVITVIKASGEKQEKIVVEISGDKQSATVK